MSDNDSELDDKLYDLFVIACLLVRDVDPSRIVTAALPVLGGLWRADCYRDLLNRQLTTRPGLRNKVQTNARIVRDTVRGSASPERMAGEAAGISEHFVMLVRTSKRTLGGSMLDYGRIIGQGGYPLYLTEAGAAYAREAAPRYPELTTEKLSAGMVRFRLLKPHERVV